MKRPFTLIEVVVGFVLASVVLGVLFKTLFETTIIKDRIDRAEKEIMARAYCQQRIDEICLRLIKEEGKASLYTTNEEDTCTLHFLFNNGIDPDPAFCDEVHGKLFIQNENLIFSLEGNAIPGQKNPEPRIEILKKGVQAIGYSFLIFGEKGSEIKNIWPQKSQELPCYMKFTFNENESYAFWIQRPLDGVPIP